MVVTSPSTPLPRADQVLVWVCQRAMLLAAMPPALVNSPQTKTSGPRKAMALTSVPVPSLVPFKPLPRLDQAEPFQRTMRLAGELPAPVNVPPTKTPSVLAATARPDEERPSPEPNATQLVPVLRATWFITLSSIW